MTTAQTGIDLQTPPGPGQFIPLSDLQTLRRSPLAALLNIGHRYGDLFSYPVGFWTIYVVNHPDYIKHILQDNQRNYSKHTFQYNLLGMAAGQGLLSSDGAYWLQQRRLVQPAFHRERIAAIGTTVTDATLRMVERWEAVQQRNQPLDIDAEMMRVTLEIVGKALFNVDLSEQANSFVQAVLTALSYIIKRGSTPIAFPLRIPTPGNRRFQNAVHTMDRAIYAMIAERRKTNRDQSDMLSMLMSTRDAETGEQMNDRQIRDEIITFLIAGHETVAGALTWTFYLLSKNPTVERMLRQELITTLGQRPPTFQDLPNLTYTRMVVDESMRLYPPVWLMTRRAIAGDEIGGYRIPANALMVMSQYLTHRHPSFWENPEGFDPLRFTPEQIATRPRFAYFPFGGGPHLCIGNTFALTEAQLILATVAQRYRLALIPSRPVEIETLVTIRPKHGLWMTLHPQVS
jgi:cytochrome P450